MGNHARIDRLGFAASQHGIFALLLAMVVGSVLLVPEFRTATNIVNILNQSSVLAVLALGQTLVIAAGLIDLSVGQLLGLVSVLACDLMAGRSAYTMPAILLALAVGGAVGLVNGVLCNTLRVHPLVLTFAMLSVLQGSIFLYTDRSVGQASPEILWLANGTIFGVPFPPILVAGCAWLMHLLLHRSRFGLHLRAVGASEDSARRAGIHPRRVKLLVYILSGLSAGLAGILVAGRLGTGYPNAGVGFELDAIVAVVLGGTALSGGRGTIAGTLAAVLVLGVLSNLLNLLEVSAFAQMVVKGLVVIVAVLANRPARQVGT